ncbi:hypothetical protein ARTSIC4J27_4167 [Pseudarthrobacter siccitolerans]|uniref:Uncharacterized protein n=1 Tax=Pseudarthrobacter siccitolerans TaxID=861266 RepID=A0A024H8G1_9MICC|nr:hypothetical protein ARTSIC4J27_4167 [Pseudarthrobacter siccitolerans]
MRGDVRQPELVRCRGGEIPLDQVVVDRRPWICGSVPVS